MAEETNASKNFEDEFRSTDYYLYFSGNTEIFNSSLYESIVYADELGLEFSNLSSLKPTRIVQVVRKPKALRLCGTVPFCNNVASSHCRNITIKDCEQCSMVQGSLFLFFLILLGLAIVAGNLLILAVGHLRYRKHILTKSDVLKISLALADVLTGTIEANK